jgi:hypothetical protein
MMPKTTTATMRRKMTTMKRKTRTTTMRRKEPRFLLA